MSSSLANSRLLVAMFVAVGVSLALGCRERPEIRYETEHLRIGTDFDEPLCRGYLDHLELVAATAATALAADVSDPIEVYLWSDLDWDANGLCTVETALGCYTGEAVYSSLGSADHEIVHGVVDSFADPVPFWSEGTARGFQSERTWFGESDPVSNLELGRPALNYGTSSAFSRWLFEAYGPDLYQKLLRHPGDGREALESTYGMSAEQAQEEYFQDSPFSYGAMVDCEHDDLSQDGPDSWSEAIDIDCDDHNVWGGPYGMGAYRVVEIRARGHYSISTSAPSLSIGRCQDEDLELAPAEGDPQLGDIPHWTPTSPTLSLWFSAETLPAIIDLAPGRYEVVIAQEGYEAQTHALSISPSAGPVPHTPESTQ